MEVPGGFRSFQRRSMASGGFKSVPEASRRFKSIIGSLQVHSMGFQEHSLELQGVSKTYHGVSRPFSGLSGAFQRISKGSKAFYGDLRHFRSVPEGFNEFQVRFKGLPRVV